MPPKKNWGSEESSDDDSSSAASGAAKLTAGVPRRKFDDEEGEDSDVLDSWDAAEDSEVEREKAKKAAEAKAEAEAKAKAAKKSKAERIALRQAERKAAAEEEESEEEETELERRQRLLRAQKESDFHHAEDLFAGVGSNMAGRTNTKATVVIDPADPNRTVELGSLPLFNPRTKTQLDALGRTMGPLLGQHHRMPSYVAFLQDLNKALAKELPSDQLKKIASTLTAMSNEKMKAEKASEKTGKKKGKAKTSLVTTRNNTNDVQAYEEEAFGDDDFM